MGGFEFDEFYESFFDRVARALALTGANRDLAHDATQEGFARALRHWRKVREMDRPDGWVYVVAMNQLRDRRRRSERRRERALTTDDGGVDNTRAVATRVSVRDAIALLPTRQRQAVVLRYLADLPIADVADAMGCATGTVKATLHQALRNLRVELDDTENHDADR
ncbi:MAG TPA: sigma-70 family RNA polymerase sigma factor [Acidimicrobiia bacterium]|nr:sigma-70 family RNA polymerase sigma factor [Acidimicrobiia bacterium]